ncbi:hypothetical protein [Chelatococcus reniformis]|nr:hypothetical protein [Chelatococcus reniformis]
MMALLVTMVAQDYDRVADVLVSDYNDICEIFHEALPHLDDAALASRMESVVGLNAPSLRVHDQSTRTDAALRVLIELHAAIEDLEDHGLPWAARLNGRIWAYLARYVARRTYQMDG